MPQVIDYYVSLNSPWTYLGHDRFVALARKHGKRIHIEPVDFAPIFAATGGLPLPKRSPQRQAYRLQELERWRTFLNLPLVLQPANWPGQELAAAGMIYAARERGDDAVALAGAVLHANWVDEKNIGDDTTLDELAAALGMDGEALRAAAAAADYPRIREAASQRAIERGVFGAPSYLYGESLYWGQDRLDFLERELRAEGNG
ncbi:MAG: 2-hydroxychromene-2-carboxylate isomerase [Gammaproteobacteria bacterium]|nr:2-hydroxychromene-2-carboxylate isomerase [Gammaproteobacteria bacterium]